MKKHHYAHGEPRENDPSRLWCSRCDAFEPRSHFPCEAGADALHDAWRLVNRDKVRIGPPKGDYDPSRSEFYLAVIALNAVMGPRRFGQWVAARRRARATNETDPRPTRSGKGFDRAPPAVVFKGPRRTRD